MNTSSNNDKIKAAATNAAESISDIAESGRPNRFTRFLSRNKCAVMIGTTLLVAGAAATVVYFRQHRVIIEELT